MNTQFNTNLNNDPYGFLLNELKELHSDFLQLQKQLDDAKSDFDFWKEKEEILEKTLEDIQNQLSECDGNDDEKSSLETEQYLRKKDLIKVKKEVEILEEKVRELEDQELCDEGEFLEKFEDLLDTKSCFEYHDKYFFDDDKEALQLVEDIENIDIATFVGEKPDQEVVFKNEEKLIEYNDHISIDLIRRVTEKKNDNKEYQEVSDAIELYEEWIEALNDDEPKKSELKKELEYLQKYDANDIVAIDYNDGAEFVLKYGDTCWNYDGDTYEVKFGGLQIDDFRIKLNK